MRSNQLIGEWAYPPFVRVQVPRRSTRTSRLDCGRGAVMALISISSTTRLSIAFKLGSVVTFDLRLWRFFLRLTLFQKFAKLFRELRILLGLS